ncbi:MAG: serine hydroxymethyltransferase [Candidatus Kerfeldbacteria bacterium]|nr:serine hydroxymethyltransferase [Candidatus Kerfeldbacteria bacterium]
MPTLNQSDPELAAGLQRELERQRSGLEMIASENFVSPAVLAALGSVATNKYSEGYPGNRYYGGNQFIDQVESLAVSRAQQLFGAEHVNVQPLSGAPANIAVYSALLQPGDTVLGMDLGHGGHLTHGHPVTWMAKLFNFVRYKTDPATGLIDYDQVRELAKAHQPKLILVGYSAYSREIDYDKFKTIADEVGALTMADVAHIAGLIAAKLMNNPVPLFDVVTTTTHKTLRGPRGGMILCREQHAKAIDKAVFPGFQGGPHENNIAAKAVAFKEALEPSFKEYAQQIMKNAKALEHAFRAGGLTICFQQTDNHLLLLDVTSVGLSGKQAQDLLDSVGITVNKNMIPDDQRKPMDPSGIRIGTPALTTRGFTEADMTRIGEMIVKVLRSPNDESVQQQARQLVRELTAAHPLYPGLAYR